MILPTCILCFTFITLKTYFASNLNVIYVTNNETTTFGSNGSLLTPNNTPWELETYYNETKDGNCSSNLCILSDGDNVTYVPSSINTTCNETRIYDICNNTAITYILSECNRTGEIDTINITYNVSVVFNPFTSPVPIAEKYINTKDATIIAPVIPCVLIIAFMIAGYLYYRAKIKTRSDHEYKEPQYTTVD
ncbi:RL11 Family [Baboon cytomegalovirus]|nr:RL11 Family [Baboon cytomegalovirus]